jgi:hypothetical protein
MNAAKPPQYLSSLKRASLFTAAHASRNAFQKDEGAPSLTLVLTRKTRGQGETVVSKEEKNKTPLAFLKNTSNHT